MIITLKISLIFGLAITVVGCHRPCSDLWIADHASTGSIGLLVDPRGAVLPNPEIYWRDQYLYQEGPYTREEIHAMLLDGLANEAGVYRRVATDIFLSLFDFKPIRDIMFRHPDFPILLEAAVTDQSIFSRKTYPGLQPRESGRYVIDTFGVFCGRGYNNQPIDVSLSGWLSVGIDSVAVRLDGEDNWSLLPLSMYWFHANSAELVLFYDRFSEQFEEGDYALKVVYRIEMRPSYSVEDEASWGPMTVERIISMRHGPPQSQ